MYIPLFVNCGKEKQFDIIINMEWKKLGTNNTNYSKRSEGLSLTTNDGIEITTNDSLILIVVGMVWGKIIANITSWIKI